MTVAEVVKKMVEYSKGDLHDINHFMKVYAYAKTIAEGENLSPEQQNTIDSGYCMMMTYNIRNTIYKFFRQI